MDTTIYTIQQLHNLRLIIEIIAPSVRKITQQKNDISKCHFDEEVIKIMNSPFSKYLYDYDGLISYFLSISFQIFSDIDYKKFEPFMCDWMFDIIDIYTKLKSEIHKHFEEQINRNFLQVIINDCYDNSQKEIKMIIEKIIPYQSTYIEEVKKHFSITTKCFI